MVKSCVLWLVGFLINKIRVVTCFHVDGIDDGYGGHVGHVPGPVGGEGHAHCEGVDQTDIPGLPLERHFRRQCSVWVILKIGGNHTHKMFLLRFGCRK